MMLTTAFEVRLKAPPPWVVLVALLPLNSQFSMVVVPLEIDIAPPVKASPPLNDMSDTFNVPTVPPRKRFGEDVVAFAGPMR